MEVTKGQEVAEMQEPAKGESDNDETYGGFSSRYAFWLSAIGCAAGYGNVWRFPQLAFTYGPPFFVSYIISMFLVALPLSMLEFGIGQVSRGGTTTAFRAIDKKAAAIGWGFMNTPIMLTFYPVLSAWTAIYFLNSFKGDVPWNLPATVIAACTSASPSDCLKKTACVLEGTSCLPDPLYYSARFFEESLSGGEIYSGEGVNRFYGYVFLAEVITWILVFLSVIGGAKILGYVNYVITAAPAVMLIVITGVGISLEGSSHGLVKYVGRFDIRELGNADLWIAAVGQTLFTLGAAQGAMVAFGSHNKRDQNFVQDSYVVAFGDTMFAFTSGIAVFSVLGFVSQATGVSISDLPVGGPSLVFQTFPVGLSSGLPFPYAQIVSGLFFLTLYMLGMSTISGLLEGCSVAIFDSKLFFKFRSKLKRWHIYLCICVILLLFAFLFSTNLGLIMLGKSSDFVTNFAFLFVAGGEALAAGWFAAFDLWKERSGSAAVYTHLISYIGGITIGSVLGFSTPSRVGSILGPVVGFAIIVGGFVAAMYLSNETGPEGESYSFMNRIYYMTFYNVNQLRLALNDAGCKDSIWRLPVLWLFLTKYFIPLVACILFFAANFDESVWGSPIGSIKYPALVFIFASIFPLMLIAAVLVSFFYPPAMNFLLPADEFTFSYNDDIESQFVSKLSNIEETASPITESSVQEEY